MAQPWVAIQRNPRSGSGARAVHLRELIDQLRRGGVRARLFKRREMLGRRLGELGRCEGLIGLVAAGGDGTVNDLINRYPGWPLAVLPLGTENLLARYLGVRRSGRDVAAMILAGERRRLDLGTVNGRRFALMAGIGFDGEVIRRLDACRVGHIRRRDYVPLFWRSLRTYGYPEFRLSADGGPPLPARTAVLTNLPVYGFGLRFAPAARGDDGRLDACLFPPRSGFQLLRYLSMVARGTHPSSPEVHCLRAARVRIESDQPVPIQIDGEAAGWTPADIAVVPGALEVFVPTPN